MKRRMRMHARLLSDEKKWKHSPTARPASMPGGTRKFCGYGIAPLKRPQEKYHIVRRRFKTIL